MSATLVSINVGVPQAVSYRGRQILTGIFKTPVEGPVLIRELNLEGDKQADLSVHGGRDKAVYLYAAENYDLWRSELGRDLPYGHFGENLTITGILEQDAYLDDVLEVGGALLQVSQPRLPCYKLGIKMGDQRFLRRFLRSSRSGFYCRVFREGEVEVGQPITLVSHPAGTPTIAEVVAEQARS